jgi:hypothetical protein
LIGIGWLETTDLLANSASTAATVEAAECGWWYSIDLPTGQKLTAMFTDVDLLPSGKRSIAAFLRDQFHRSPLTSAGRHFTEADAADRRWVGFDARSSVRRVVISDGWIAVGDAAMAFDPLYGRGLKDAVISGIGVAEWLLGSCPLEDGLPAWIREATGRFNEYCLQRTSTYCAESRWAASPFWQRRRSNLGNLRGFNQRSTTHAFH